MLYKEWYCTVSTVFVILFLNGNLVVCLLSAVFDANVSITG